MNTGDVMLELVPTGEALIVEAKIMPKVISRIRMKDEVRIRFSAYDSSIYGSVDGRVLRISPDAVVDKNNDGVSHYLVDVGMMMMAMIVLVRVMMCEMMVMMTIVLMMMMIPHPWQLPWSVS